MSTFIWLALIYAAIGIIITAGVRAVWKRKNDNFLYDDEVSSLIIGSFWVASIPVAIAYVLLAHVTGWVERKITALIEWCKKNG